MELLVAEFNFRFNDSTEDIVYVFLFINGEYEP